MKTKTLKPEEYLASTGRIRMLNTRLVTGERLMRMANAKDAADAIKVLSECGYDISPAVGKTGAAGLYALSAVINRDRAATLALLEKIVPNKMFTDYFRISIDYHNIKVMLKSAYLSGSALPSLMPGGRFTEEKMTGIIASRDFSALGDAAGAVENAREILLKTLDGQLADFELDRAMLADMSATAGAAKSTVLEQYASLYTDCVNLKAAVRLARMSGGEQYASKVYAEGGSVGVKALLESRSVFEAFKGTAFEKAAAEGEKIVQSGSFTAFEAACAAALDGFVGKLRYASYGAEVLLSYLAAKEREYTAVRRVISAVMTGGNAIEAAEGFKGR
ncbi:MAG: V-type ATPase subunit [Clostridia bacterium]|nr:V-type ATPase subunit [Clostridia bacterium]